MTRIDNTVTQKANTDKTQRTKLILKPSKTNAKLKSEAYMNTRDTQAPVQFESFADFYPYYLAEHSDPRCRTLHYIGSALVLCLLAYAISTSNWQALWLMPVIGYGFAWVGHFFIEKNRPATFQYPFYSFMGDWVMLKDFLFNKLPKSEQP